jgi:hypothetical protein
MCDITTYPLTMYEEWLGADFWWLPSQQTLGPTFSHSGLQQNKDAWVEGYNCFLSGSQGTKP